jgi:hypothetical protein
MIKTMMYLCFSSYIYQHESEREFPIAKDKKKADGLELFFFVQFACASGKNKCP